MNKISNVIKISFAIILDIYVFFAGWLGLSVINFYYYLGKMLGPFLGIDFGYQEEYHALRESIIVIIGLISITLAFLSKAQNNLNKLIKVVRIVSIVLTLYMAYELIFTFITIYNIYNMHIR